MKISLVLVSLLMLSFVSCSQLAEPSPTKTALLVGSAQLTTSDFPSYNNLTANGVFTSGIRVAIIDQSGKMIDMNMEGNEGFFKTSDIMPGIYYIEELNYKLVQGNGWVQVSMWHIHGRKFSKININPGVNNIGLVKWSCDYNKSNTYKFDGGYSDVQNMFSSIYPKSAWNNAVWTNVTVE